MMPTNPSLPNLFTTPTTLLIILIPKNEPNIISANMPTANKLNNRDVKFVKNVFNVSKMLSMFSIFYYVKNYFSYQNPQ